MINKPQSLIHNYFELKQENISLKEKVSLQERQLASYKKLVAYMQLYYTNKQDLK